MHLLHTDRLCCPRCGPEFGLIALVARAADRRLIDGSFGCPNCRERYPVRGGFADLRPPPRKPLPNASSAPLPEDAPLRIAALLGIAEGPAYVAALGLTAEIASQLSAIVPELEVVAAGEGRDDEREAAGVSRIACGRTFPLRDRAVGGTVISGADANRWLPEARRVVVPGGRIVLIGADPTEGAYAEGLHVIAREGEWTVLEPRTGRASTGVKLPVVLGWRQMFPDSKTNASKHLRPFRDRFVWAFGNLG
jgi:uncharacterized protein YbaR (Trm112 family)